MQSTKPEQILDAIGRARHADRIAESIEQCEQEFVDVLSLIKNNKELRPLVVKVFSDMLRDQSCGSYLLIEFCMHELRWSEFREEAERIYKHYDQLVAKNKTFGKPLQHVMELRKVLESFDDHWQSKDLFSYYCSKQDNKSKVG